MSDLELEVTQIETLAPNIKMFEFRGTGDDALPPFEAGAHIDIRTGNGLVRSYSLANDPAETHRYVTAVLKEAGGTGGSRSMHENVKRGDVLQASRPVNNFPLVESATQHILLAGGIGITPLLAMGYRLRDRGARYHLHYCTRSPQETAFLAETREVFGEHVTYHHDGGDVSKGIKLDEVFARYPDGAHLYVCGPGGLLNATRKATAHWPSDAVHFELFSSARTAEQRLAAAEDGNAPFDIVLARSGKTLMVPADETILDVLQQNGIDMVYVCEEGWCGTCAVDLVSGKADHRDEVLDDGEKAANTKIQVCISRAIPGETLVLDL